MSRMVGNVFYVEREPPAPCEECGAVAELRPYGKGGANVCHPCAMKDPWEAQRQMAKRIRDADVIAAPADALAKHRPN